MSICPSLFFDEELYQWCSFLFLIFFDRSEPLITPEKFNMYKVKKKVAYGKKEKKERAQKEEKKKGILEGGTTTLYILFFSCKLL